MQIEVGGTYVTTTHEEVRIVARKPQDVPYPFMDSDGYLWSAAGERPCKHQPRLVCAANDFAAIAALSTHPA